MNEKPENRQTDVGHDGINWLLAFIFKSVFPLWKLHEGEIPETVLSELDICGDWPAGTARRATERLNRDRKLVEQLEEHFASRNIVDGYEGHK
jgi:hypothetical protein